MGSSYIDKFGYRRQRANPVSRVGVFPYTGEQIDQPRRDPKTGEPIVKVNPLTGEVLFERDENGKIVRDKDGNPVPQFEMQFGLEPKKLYPVLRGPDELFKPDAIESFNGVPIRVGHLMLGDEDKSKDGKKLVKADDQVDGCIYNVRPSLDEPGYLIAEFCIYSDRMKKVLKEGKIRELSLGYTCVYEPEEGLFNGIPYMFKQTNLRGNHLALVKHGRCGSSVCVCDEAVVTFDSLPDEGESLMDEKKKEDQTLDRAKALASRIKGGDEQLAQDCLDFAEFSPESRKEAIAMIKGKKDKKEEEKEAEDKAPKAAKDTAVPPTPPPPPAPEKESEPAAPAASSAEAPTQNPDDQHPAPPPADVPSPKDGEKPSEDKAPKACCDKCGKPVADCLCKKEDEAVAKDCEAKEVKDCGNPPAQGATQPSVPTPVSAIQALAGEEKKSEEKKDDEKKEAEAKDCGDKAPKAVEITVEKVEESKPGDAIAEAISGKETEDQSADKRIKADVKAEHDNVPPGKTAKVAQDEYVAFVAEFTAAQALANQLRPYIKETFDSAPMREIEVARLAAKHIDNLAFVADEADDEKVLLAVRGYAAAIAMDAAPAVAGAPSSTTPDLVDTMPTADVIAQDEAVAPASAADAKGLAEFLNK